MDEKKVTVDSLFLQRHRSVHDVGVHSSSVYDY